MADRDNYHGYGDPDGRYMERGEYGPDPVGSSRSRSSRDDDRNWRSDRGRGDNDRGWFERAEDEVRSWFGAGDDRDRNRNDDRYRNEDRNRSDDRYRSENRSYGGQSRYGSDDRYRNENRSHDDNHYRGGSGRYGYDDMRGQGDRNWRSQYSSGGYESGGSRYGNTEGRWQDRGGYAGGIGGRGDADWSSQNQRYGSHQDQDYHDWRRRQMDMYDRDYDEYRRENRDKFHSDFSNWRTQRQNQRSTVRQVQEHMDVVGSDGEHVGTVDKVRGDTIILTKSDPSAGGHHHSIPCGWIDCIENGKVKLNKSADQARKAWQDVENRRALFEDDDNNQSEGAHNLNRSFSGTYENR